ncbi:hypothetical protein D6C86_00869 [Aureobasidium pullulans]|uniref:Uncharacterized protein n=1 Tax=Aureobasidium pullulans TaxID=5580 RepID=A0A4S9V728_AURPU|nr:hypothetical protein D6C94_02464 [Aureobasidium pullulans]THZ47419.1 hypothetical protein D6C87_01468 [Aureobasidium pullulans]THZ66809.1 hypothetical protein D6C86_00869 [Aureobasidium pullulans]THZ97356.1 hypothetical protein D6C88_01263 [Aureobasidium pullulans]
MVVAIGLDILPWSMLLGLARQSPVAEPQVHIQERSARPVPLAGLRIPSQSAVAVLVTGDVGGFRRQQRQLAEHDSGLESVEAIIVGLADVLLENLTVAEVGVNAFLGHGTADVDAVTFVIGGVHGVVDSGQVLRDCSNHESGDGENFRRDSQQVHKRGVSMDGR